MIAAAKVNCGRTRCPSLAQVAGCCPPWQRPVATTIPATGTSSKRQSLGNRRARPAAGLNAYDATTGRARMIRCQAGEGNSNDDAKWDKAELMGKIKSYGIAGTLSYVITELMFWAGAIPAAAFSYHSTTGEWLSWGTDKAQLLGIAAGFVTVVRFAVPLRMAAALALTPSVDRVFVQRYLTKEEDE